jgi:hypothetical protein
MFFPRWPRWASALLSPLILLAAGCATNGTATPHAPPPPLPGTEACIFTVNLNDWTVIDNSTLIVYAPLRKAPYLVKLFSPIFDLQFRESLGFEDIEHNGQLCKDDYVVARGDSPNRTSIIAVRALTPEQARQMIAAAKQGDTSKTDPSKK